MAWELRIDPGTGRYLTADPIGLAGGMNLYAYVGGNPVNLVDPEGKSAAIAIPAVGVLIVTAIIVRHIQNHPPIIPSLPRPEPPADEARDGSQDPSWAPGYVPYDPGNCDGKCIPCKDSPIFYHPDQTSHPCRGHQIRHRQSPYPDCRCWPYRLDF